MWFRKKKAEIEVEKEEEFVACDVGLDELVGFIKLLAGIDLEPKKDVLSKRFLMYCTEKKIKDFYKLKDVMLKDDLIYNEVMDLVSVNETYFYRELPQLQECIEYIKTSHKRMKILCAPCSTGEEVYSLSLLANEAGLSKNDFEILGIDISFQAIEGAEEGVYSARSLHRLDKNLVDKYFIKKDNKYKIKKDDFTNLSFKIINVFEDEFRRLGSFDIIFSRNMMIYFNDEYKLKAIKNFYDLLKSDGRLYTGHADLVPENEYFTKLIKNRLHYYIKN